MGNNKIKCLVLNESKDIESYGSIDLSSTSYCLTVVLNETGFAKCVDYTYEKDFILHFYFCDTLDIDMVVGVRRFDKCSIEEINSLKRTIKIKCHNKKYFNMGEINLLRKDKISNLLSFDDDAII